MRLQVKQYIAVAFALATLGATTACSDNNDRSNTGNGERDSSITDTRRNSAPDTTNYISNDSAFTDASPRSGTGIGQDSQ